MVSDIILRSMAKIVIKNGGYLISNELHHILGISEHYRKRMEKK